MAISEFWSGDFEEKWAWEGPKYPPISWSLKKGTRNFNFGYNEPSRDILRPLGRYNHPGEKTTTKETINTHPWCAFWQKIQILLFCR